MKIAYLSILFLLALSTCAVAQLTQESYKNVQFTDDRGFLEEWNGLMTLNLQAGWNLVPLRVLRDASGRYWSLKDESTCPQEVFQNVYMYSPVKKDYVLLPHIDDLSAPKTRENTDLLNDMQIPAYHAFGGSGWVYVKSSCSIKSDSGAQLISASMNMDEQDVSYTKDNLVLKAGWNLIAADVFWSASERTPAQVFANCGLEKVNLWNAKLQKWTLDASEMTRAWTDSSANEKFTPADSLQTFVVKTTKDCLLAKNVFDGSVSPSAPPAIPN